MLIVLRDHRVLRRYTYTAMVAGLGLLLLPLLPGLGRTINGSRIWIGLGPFSFQPGEIAKIVLAVFFAGYLVQTRDVALARRAARCLGLQPAPRPRPRPDPRRLAGQPAASWSSRRDLGSSLLFFGLFVAMLYVATERRSWIAIGLVLFSAGAYLAYLLFGHVQQRVLLWLDPFSPQALAVSDQLVRGPVGHGQRRAASAPGSVAAGPT